MAISDQLTLLNNTKTAIRTAINNKGGSVTDSTPFADYSTAIDNLPSGGSGNPLLTSIDVSDFTGTTFNQAENYITSAVVPNGVTAIDYGAFQSCSSLTSVRLPNTLTTIGTQAFANTNIANLVIPNSVTTLNQGALRELSSTSLTLPNAITSLPNYCIYNSQYLTSLIIPSTVTSIGDYAINNCKRLTYVIVESTTPPTLGTSVFDSTNNCPIYVPASSLDAYKTASNWSTYADRIQAIPEDVKPAFKFTSSVDSSKDITVNCEDTETAGTLTANDLGMSSQQIDEFRSAENTGSVEIGDCVKIYMAADCYTAKGISEVKLNEGLERIGDFAFGGMSALTEITIPSTVTNISYQAFYADRALTSITCLATTPPTLGSDVFGDTNNCPIYVPASSLEDYKTASNWSTYASRIQPLPTALKWTSADGTKEISIACEDLKAAGTFADNDRYTADPDDMMGTVEGSAEIGDCVTTIGEHAFDYCESLTSVTIPNSVTTIGDYTFNGCSSLTSVTCLATTPPTLSIEALGYDINYPIYVPAESVDAYKAASNWSSYASRIQAIPAE